MQEFSVVSSSNRCANKDIDDPCISRCTNTKELLAKLDDRFHAFEEELEAKKKIRKDTETSKLDNLKETVHQLEKSLNDETRRRTDAVKSMHSLLQSQITNVQEKIETIFTEKLNQLNSAVITIEDRIKAAERAVEECDAKGLRRVEELEMHTAQIVNDIENTQLDIKNEHEHRPTADASNLERLKVVHESIESKFESQANLQSQSFKSLKDEICEVKKAKQMELDHTRNETYRIIEDLRRRIEEESLTRQQNDNDMIAALQQYTQVLHSSLKILNSD